VYFLLIEQKENNTSRKQLFTQISNFSMFSPFFHSRYLWKTIK